MAILQYALLMTPLLSGGARALPQFSATNSSFLTPMSLWSGSSSTISLPSSTPRLPVPSSSFTPGPSVIFPCFGDNMKLPNLHLKSGRTSYLIECGVDLLNGDVPNRGPVYVNNFRQCLKACDAHAGCSHVAFSKTPSATGEYPCYLKHSKSTRKADGDIISGAIPTINATNKTVTIEYVSPFKEMDVGTGESSSSVVAVSSSSASAISSSTNSSSHQVPLPWSSSKSSTRSTSETETETKPSSISQFVSTVAMPDEVSSKTSASPSAYSSTAVPSATSTPSGYVPARSSESSTSAQPSTVAPHTTVVSFSSESLPSTAFNGNSTVQPIGSVNATYSAKAISQLTTTFYPVTTTNPRIYATSSEVPWTENVSLSPSPTKDEVEPVKSLEVVAWNSTGPITADPTHIVHPTSSPVENSTLVKHVGGHDVFRPILLTYKFPASVSGNSGTVSSTRTPIYSWVKSRSSVIKPTATHGMNSTTNGHTIVHGNTFIDTLPSVSLHVPWNASATVTPPTPIIVNATTAFLASTSTSNVGSLEHGQAAETTSTAPDGWSRLVTKTLMSTLTLPLPLKHAYSPWKYYNTTTFANATTSSLPSTSTPVVTSSTYGQAAVTTFTPWTFRNRATSSFSSVPVSTTLVGGNSTRSSLVSTSAPVVSSSTNGSSIFVPTLTHYNPTKSVVSCSTNGSWIFVATHTCYDPTNSVVPHGWSKSNTGTLTTTLPTSSIWSDSSSGISTSASRNGTGSVHFASTVIGNLSILYPHTITAPASSTATGAHLPETTFTWYDSAASVAPTSTKNGTSSVLSSTWALQVPTPSRQYVAETTFTRYDPAASIAPGNWSMHVTETISTTLTLPLAASLKHGTSSSKSSSSRGKSQESTVVRTSKTSKTTSANGYAAETTFKYYDPPTSAAPDGWTRKVTGTLYSTLTLSPRPMAESSKTASSDVAAGEDTPSHESLSKSSTYTLPAGWNPLVPIYHVSPSGHGETGVASRTGVVSHEAHSQSSTRGPPPGWNPLVPISTVSPSTHGETGVVSHAGVAFHTGVVSHEAYSESSTRGPPPGWNPLVPISTVSPSTHGETGVVSHTGVASHEAHSESSTRGPPPRWNPLVPISTVSAASHTDYSTSGPQHVAVTTPITVTSPVHTTITSPVHTAVHTMVTVHTYSTIDVTKTLPCTTCHGGMTTVVVSSIVEHTKTYLSTTTAANPIVSTNTKSIESSAPPASQSSKAVGRITLLSLSSLTSTASALPTIPNYGKPYHDHRPTSSVQHTQGGTTRSESLAPVTSAEQALTTKKAGSEEPTSVSAFTSEFDSTVASSAPSSDFSASVSAWATESSSLDTASASFSSSTTSDFNTSWTSTSANRRPTSHKIKNSGASGFSINVLLAAALALAVAVFSH